MKAAKGIGPAARMRSWRRSAGVDMGRELSPKGMITPMQPVVFEEVFADLPLLHQTPRSWAELAAAHLPEFLADHAVCEQQVAVYALSLTGFYPEDGELVERAAALAAEEV